MTRKEEIRLTSLKYADAHQSDYTNEMYDIGDIEKAFEAGAEWSDENPDGKMLLHVLNKGVKQGKREITEGEILTLIDWWLDRKCDEGEGGMFFESQEREGMNVVLEFKKSKKN